MKNLSLVLLALTMVSCASISSLGDGKTHMVNCPALFTSKESCADKGADDHCSNGKYKITAANTNWTFMRGYERSVTIVCDNK
jgi:hypothetical protein